MSDDAQIAFVLRDKRVEWTVLQQRKHRAEIVQQQDVALDWPEGVTDLRSPEAAAFLKTKVPAFKGRLGLVIPADRVLLRVVELPSTDPAELFGMAELQVDKFSPFPSDQMSVSLEVLAEQDGVSRVMIAAVQHQVIDQLGNFLLQAGLYPQSVDVDVLGWWTLISDQGRVRTEGQEIVVIHDDRCAQLLVVRDGTPVMIRALDPSLGITDAVAADDFAQEIEYTLMTLESGWGARPTAALTLWSHEQPAPSLVTTLAGAAGFPVETASLRDLPPLSEGVSRRMSRIERPALDLAPAAWRSGIQSKRYQRKAALVGGIALGAWALVMLGLWLFTARQKTLLAEAQTGLVRMQTELQEVTDLKNQVLSLEQYADRSRSGLESLREITELLPPGVDITSITYAKNAQITLRGEADTDAPIYELVKQLEGSSLFEAIQTERISTQVRGGRTRSMFLINIRMPGSETEGDAS
jgi:type II secretory pathway component PulL